jgi:hypothetical protein
MLRTPFALAPAGASLALLIASSAAAGVRPFTLSILVLEGDMVPGVGMVTTVDAISVNNAGQWLVEVDTNFPDAAFDGAVLSQDGVFVREGDPLALPAGASVGSFDSVWLSEGGNVGWNLFLDGLTASTDSGIFFNTDLLLQEGSLSTAEGFSPGTPYIGFFESRMVVDNQIFVVASVDDPAIASSVDRALVWLSYDPVKSNLTELVVAKEGDLLPEIADAVTDFGTGQENFAINELGGVLFTASLTGPTATNGALYRDRALVARKGGDSPVEGRTYTNIGTSTRVDMNNLSDVVFAASLSGDTASDQIIIRNGAKFVQEGDPAPGAGGDLLTGFNTAPVRIADDGDVIWYGNLTGAAANNQGLWKGDQLLLRKGDLIEGMTLTTIAGTTATGGITEGLAISRDGRHIIFRGLLDADLVGAFLITFDEESSPADLNGDGTVDGADLGLLLSTWGPCPDCPFAACAADLNGDCTVDGADLGLLVGEWD